VALKLIFIATPFYTCIAPGLRKRQLHRFIKQFETLYLIDGLLRALHTIKYYECLSFRLEVRLGYDVDDLAIFREEFIERLLELVDLDALFKIAYVQTRERLVTLYTCRSAMTRTSRWVGGR
jgi:hypothetical protein